MIAAGPDVWVGLMSGTSLDGVDGVAVRWRCASQVAVLAHVHRPFDPALRDALLALNTPLGVDELHRSALAALGVAETYARVVDQLRSVLPAGLAIRALGAHGQTVRHQPASGYTIQLLNAAQLAERTGCTVVADFRSRDVAAGGQGAPLVPAFHQAFFGADGCARGVLNIGGMANLTAVNVSTPPPPTTDVAASQADSSSHQNPVHEVNGGQAHGPGAAALATTGLDCGPGNVLLDGWCARHTGRPFDAEGAWGRSGQVDSALLNALLSHPYFSLPAPKSTGREAFNLAWLDQMLGGMATVAPQDVQATLVELTAVACANCARSYIKDSKELIVCGGGAANRYLMERLAHHLLGWRITPSDHHGLPHDQVEAVAFAWLAQRTLAGLTGNLPQVTGAAGPRILGAIYRA